MLASQIFSVELSFPMTKNELYSAFHSGVLESVTKIKYGFSFILLFVYVCVVCAHVRVLR